MLELWSHLISFRPPLPIQYAIKARGLLGSWHFHKIEDAYGPVNLDWYAVEIDRLPRASSVGITEPGADNRPASDVEFFYFLRTNINQFVASQLANFAPYDAVPDGALWALPVPLGAAIHIDMLDPTGVLFPSSNPDDGSVVVTAASASQWIFSTVFTPLDGGHPVSGNREFSLTDRSLPGQYTLYTRGADRPTGAVDFVVQSKIFAMADALWMSFQTRSAAFINDNGGLARIPLPGTPTGFMSERYDWEQAKTLARYNPTVPWI
ncbi:hypothetical protein [Rhizobium sp. LEGMi135b]